MKKSINFLIPLFLIFSQAPVTGFSNPSNDSAELKSLSEATFLRANSLGAQVKILDIRKEATEGFIKSRKSTILLEYAETAATTAGSAIGVMMISVFFSYIPIATGELIYEIGGSAKNRVVRTLLKTSGKITFYSPFIAFTAGAVYAGYTAYENKSASTKSQQIEKLRGMKSDSEIADEYSSILAEFVALKEQYRLLSN